MKQKFIFYKFNNLQNKLFLFLSMIIVFIFSGCNQLYDLPDPVVPLSQDYINSLDDLVNFSTQLGYVPSYSANGEKTGLLSNSDLGACVVMRKGNVKCWGYNSTGQLGTNDTVNKVTPTTASALSISSIASGDFVVSISTALNHTCAYFKSGLKCWGDQNNGTLGNGVNSITPSLTPVTVVNLSGRKVKKVATGDEHVCVLFSDDLSVRCWGLNTDGQLGDGTKTLNITGATTNIGEKVKTIACTDYASCAVTTSRNLKCWGNTSAIRLFQMTSTPTKITSNVISVSSGEKDHFCAIMGDQTLQCFGNNANGQLGNGTTITSRTPVAVLGLTGVSMVVAGDNHTCAVTNNNTSVYCWGDNSVGQLGKGTTEDCTVPNQKVVGLPADQTIVDISASDKVNCVLLSNDDVYCWGDNNNTSFGGPLGIAKSTLFSSSAVKVLNRADP